MWPVHRYVKLFSSAELSFRRISNDLRFDKSKQKNTLLTIKNKNNEGSCKSSVSLLTRLDEAEAPEFKFI